MKYSISTLLLLLLGFCAWSQTAISSEDSLTQLELKAWGDYRFGDNAPETKKHFPKADTLAGRRFVIEPTFDDSTGLLQVELIGRRCSKEELNTQVRNDVQTLAELITAKYGAPSKIKAFPQWEEVVGGANQQYLYASWQVGDKWLFLTVQWEVVKQRENYFAKCIIIHDGILRMGVQKYKAAHERRTIIDSRKF